MVEQGQGSLGIALAHHGHAHAQQQSRVFGAHAQQGFKVTDGSVVLLRCNRCVCVSLQEQYAHFLIARIRGICLFQRVAKALKGKLKLSQRKCRFAAVVVQRLAGETLGLCCGKRLQCFGMLLLLL